MIKAQCNPSTLKMSRNPATGKAQTSLCPQQIEITFSGVNNCDGYGGCGDEWPSDLNTTFTLTYNGPGNVMCEYIGSGGGWTICVEYSATAPNAASISAVVTDAPCDACAVHDLGDVDCMCAFWCMVSVPPYNNGWDASEDCSCGGEAEPCGAAIGYGGSATIVEL